MTHPLQLLAQLFRGPAGPAGKRGPTGPRGLDGASWSSCSQLIRLPAHIVVVYDGVEDLNRLMIGFDVARELHDFYLKTCGIELRVKVSGRTEAPWPLDESYGSLLWTQYRFHYRADPFLILLRSDVSMLSNDRYLGEAFAYPGGFCAVAGDQPPGPGKERRTGRVLRTRGVAPYRHRSCLGGAARSPGGGGC